MNILWLSSHPAPRIQGYEFHHRTLDETPSLIPVVQEPGWDMILLEPEGQYSLSHILSAGKLADSLGGHLLVIGNQEDYPHTLRCLSKDQLEDGLKEQNAPSRQQKNQKNQKEKPAQASAPQETAESKPPQLDKRVLPLKGSRTLDRSFLVTVAGSQHRIGCTTQCIQLYYYLKALGFTPAVLFPQEGIFDLADMVEGKQRGNVMYIENIPFLPDTQDGFQCYVADVGTLTEDNLKTFLDGDIQVLVTGVKPWEVPETGAALNLLSREPSVILLSYCTQGAYHQLWHELAEVTQNRTVILPTQWQGEPFRAGYLLTLDQGLRPMIQKYLEDKQC